MKSKEEMIEVLDAGYTLINRKYTNYKIKKCGASYVFYKNTKYFTEAFTSFNCPQDWEILRPDLTKPQIVHLDHKGWAWDNYPEKAVERYLALIETKGVFVCWDNGETAQQSGFDDAYMTPYRNFSWTDPRPKKETRPMTPLEIVYFKGERMVFGYASSTEKDAWFTDVFCEIMEYTHYAEILDEGKRLGEWKPLEVVENE